MKKFLSIIVCCAIVFAAIFLLKKYYYNESFDNNISMKNSNLNYKIKYKGIKGAVDFTVDEKGDYYIAYSNEIQLIKNNGQSYDIYKNKDLNIFSIEYFDNKLYFSSNTKIYCYDLSSKKLMEALSNLPNYGDYKNSLIKIKGDYMYVTIGAVTNSGVVGEDNTWVKDTPYIHDITPKDITLKGLDFGKDKTGAFQSYRTKSINGQIIPEHFPGNASVLIYNLKTGNSETFAWGIRNITGMDFTNEGKLIAAVGGMENRGSRPVKGDSDYLYEIKKGVWYGWPDYSGGDPVTSPRFKGGANGLQFILENHPTTNPPGPMYQNKNPNSIVSLAIDNTGALGEKNCIYFYDKFNNELYGFNGTGSIKECVKFNQNVQILSLKFAAKEFLILDGNSGYLYSIEKEVIKKGINIDKEFYAYLLSITVIGILMTLRFIKNTN
ncbi:PQQ-dependent sugar dehydrogenase [Clostridiaceae bacterium UIB06]|uniref:PQQ-dependent sugar dehydrogenase n=1 Tax=Clostridium thailandense TaxID=2794346 RepID=A0A949X409_9CLOT|nr:PQQ-dependent sugar dehydrogenase [Clostridium thailandense]MBV7273243.1 PQQ-dependent sugar dehydrogenase [Clostridium thailandense]MCH5137960.1 PQQ-dependent sugar dehydrogenase [Clostridiaceae bacterium UIB06]